MALGFPSSKRVRASLIFEFPPAGADDNLHSDSSSLTRSSRDLSVSSKSRSGAPATTRRSTSLKRLTRQSSRAKEEEAAKHAEKDPELGLPDGQETEDAEMGLSGPSGRESPGLPIILKQAASMTKTVRSQYNTGPILSMLETAWSLAACKSES